MIRGALANPYAVVVLALSILVIGLTVLSRIPIDILPIFKTPAVQIVTFYPGMPAEIVEKDITTRLERWTGQSVGIARQESKSMTGVSIVKDFFSPGIDLSTAMSQVSSYAMSDLTIEGLWTGFELRGIFCIKIEEVVSDKMKIVNGRII